MIKDAKFYVEWFCPCCGHKNKQRVSATNSCTQCSFNIDTPPYAYNYVIYNERLLKSGNWAK